MHTIFTYDICNVSDDCCGSNLHDAICHEVMMHHCWTCTIVTKWPEDLNSWCFPTFVPIKKNSPVLSFFAQVKLLEFFFHTVIDLVITIFVVWADIWWEWLGKLTWLGFAVIYKLRHKKRWPTPRLITWEVPKLKTVKKLMPESSCQYFKEWLF